MKIVTHARGCWYYNCYYTQASEDEQYTLAELKSDLNNCRARYVHIVVDQSYSGTMVRSLRRSRHHQQVAVYASGRDNEYSYSDDFTTAWTRINHTRLCMKHVFRVGEPKLCSIKIESWRLVFFLITKLRVCNRTCIRLLNFNSKHVKRLRILSWLFEEKYLELF